MSWKALAQRGAFGRSSCTSICSHFRTSVLLVIVTAAAWLAAPAASAQTAELRGTVVDSTGSSLPGVTVSIVHTGTGVARDVVTDVQGVFRAPALQPGPYSVDSSLSGFGTDSRRLVLTVGQIADLRITLSVGAVRRASRWWAAAPPWRSRPPSPISRRSSTRSSCPSCRCSTAASSASPSCCPAVDRRGRPTAASASRPPSAAPTSAACTRCRSTAASWITRSTALPSSTSARTRCRSSACCATSSTPSTRGPAPRWSTW